MIITIELTTGWNLFSIPVNNASTDMFINDTIYEYNNGYQLVNINFLIPNKGYWIRTNEAKTISFDGDEIITLTLNLNQGWNLVGSISYPYNLNDINDINDQLILLYKYTDNVYSIDNTATQIIRPGNAYWLYSNSTNVIFDGLKHINDSIFAYGFRNPWRGSFYNDPINGQALIVVDVGEAEREEVNHIKKGLNYGWPAYEGELPFKGNAFLGGPTPTRTNTLPIYSYDHSVGASITGGIVYRGSISYLQGKYIFGDAVYPKLWCADINYNSGSQTYNISNVELLHQGKQVISIYEDKNYELYFCDMSGKVYKLENESNEITDLYFDIPGLPYRVKDNNGVWYTDIYGNNTAGFTDEYIIPLIKGNTYNIHIYPGNKCTNVEENINTGADCKIGQPYNRGHPFFILDVEAGIIDSNNNPVYVNGENDEDDGFLGLTAYSGIDSTNILFPTQKQIDSLSPDYVKVYNNVTGIIQTQEEGLQFTVPENINDTDYLFYQCGAHIAMWGTFQIFESQNDLPSHNKIRSEIENISIVEFNTGIDNYNFKIMMRYPLHSTIRNIHKRLSKKEADEENNNIISKKFGDMRHFILDIKGNIFLVNTNGDAEMLLDGTLYCPNSYYVAYNFVFHPKFHENKPYIYVYHNSLTDEKIELSRFTFNDPDNNNIDIDSKLVIEKFYPYDLPGLHVGSTLEFDENGLLILSLGDGHTGDPDNNCQNITSFMGKIIRISVDDSHDDNVVVVDVPGKNYKIPSDNPFIKTI
jgi:hypothetical protein